MRAPQTTAVRFKQYMSALSRDNHAHYCHTCRPIKADPIPQRFSAWFASSVLAMLSFLMVAFSMMTFRVVLQFNRLAMLSATKWLYQSAMLNGQSSMEGVLGTYM